MATKPVKSETTIKRLRVCLKNQAKAAKSVEDELRRQISAEIEQHEATKGRLGAILAILSNYDIEKTAEGLSNELGVLANRCGQLQDKASTEYRARERAEMRLKGVVETMRTKTCGLMSLIKTLGEQRNEILGAEKEYEILAEVRKQIANLTSVEPADPERPFALPVLTSFEEDIDTAILAADAKLSQVPAASATSRPAIKAPTARAHGLPPVIE